LPRAWPSVTPSKDVEDGRGCSPTPSPLSLQRVDCVRSRNVSGRMRPRVGWKAPTGAWMTVEVASAPLALVDAVSEIPEGPRRVGGQSFSAGASPMRDADSCIHSRTREPRAPVRRGLAGHDRALGGPALRPAIARTTSPATSTRSATLKMPVRTGPMPRFRKSTTAPSRASRSHRLPRPPPATSGFPTLRFLRGIRRSFPAVEWA